MLGGFNGPEWMEMRTPSFDSREISHLYLFRSIVDAVEQYYFIQGLFEGKSELERMHTPFMQRVMHIYNEALENALEHGNEGDPRKIVTVSVTFGTKGVVLGIRDGGAFLRTANTKERLERREIIPSTSIVASIHGYGLDVIYSSNPDVLYVEVETGTLYFVILIDTLPR